MSGEAGIGSSNGARTKATGRSTTQTAARWLYGWLSQIADPRRALRGFRGIRWFLADFAAYRRMPGAETLRWLDSRPQLHERTVSHEVDAHYFYVNAWAMKRIAQRRPRRHIDVASQTVLAGLLSVVVPVIYVDYRPLHVRLRQLSAIAADIVCLPFGSDTIASLSCLHVAEHVGLGRYGDALDPGGTMKAAAELARVLAPGGHLYFAVPVGKPRVCFNAHRIHAAEAIRSYFPGLELREFAGVHDDGRFVERVRLGEFRESDYACGMFWFSKP